jgi:hypothetical protein
MAGVSRPAKIFTPKQGQYLAFIHLYMRLHRRRGLLVNADDDGVLGWCHVEPDHIGGFGDERGIVALAPGFAPGEGVALRLKSGDHLNNHLKAMQFSLDLRF